MQNFLPDIIAQRLYADFESVKASFNQSISQIGVRYAVIDDLLPLELAQRVSRAFPHPSKMRFVSSFRERKFTAKNLDSFDPLLSDVTFSIQHQKVVSIVEAITGIKNQVPDPNLYAGGLSTMASGHFLGPHLDNSHDGSRKFYRTLNLLYYISPGWTFEDGGNLELWDSRVSSRVTISSVFNRLVIMETNPWSWHSVSRVNSNKLRHCISNYYFSESSPIGQDYFNVTAFSAWPEQRILRVVSKIDRYLRQGLRYIQPTGFGKQDLYKGPRG